jgi:DNA-binding transcriptional LysR family regulator
LTVQARTGPSSRFDDLRYGDLRTFLAAHRRGSVTAAARELRVTPSQVSKAIARLERQLGTPLLARSAHGVSLSPMGRRLLPALEEAERSCARLRRGQVHATSELTFAGPSYLMAHLLPTIAQSHKNLRVRGIELPPAVLRAYVAENVFDLGILGHGVERLPASWEFEEVGLVRKALFARPDLAARLGRGEVQPSSLVDVPFVCPIYHADGRFVPADDDCPLPVADRRPGSETQTIMVALELAAATDQLVFGPTLAARRHVRAGALVEVPVTGWAVDETQYLVLNTGRVLQSQRVAIAKAIRTALSAV